VARPEVDAGVPQAPKITELTASPIIIIEVRAPEALALLIRSLHKLFVVRAAVVGPGQGAQRVAIKSSALFAGKQGLKQRCFLTVLSPPAR
jgi:hypothetical protein